MERIVAAIRIKEGEIHLHLEEGNQKDLEERMDGLNTLSLLAGKQVLCLDCIDKLKKNGLELLASYAAKPSPFAYLLLGAGSAKGLGDLYTKAKKELVSCDLSDEKPWDRKDRLKRSLIDYAKISAKRLHAEALEYLLENVGLNLPSLEQEVAKLITYSGERCEMTLQDVHLLCAAQKSSTPWQLAEAIIWREGAVKMDEMVDLSMLLPLLAQLRMQLQHGLTLAALVERGTPFKDIAAYCPTLKPASLDKMLPIVRQRQSPFFKRSLDVLFEVELMAKNSSFDPGLILDLLLSKITLLKKHFSRPIDERSLGQK